MAVFSSEVYESSIVMGHGVDRLSTGGTIGVELLRLMTDNDLVMCTMCHQDISSISHR